MTDRLLLAESSLPGALPSDDRYTLKSGRSRSLKHIDAGAAYSRPAFWCVQIVNNNGYGFEQTERGSCRRTSTGWPVHSFGAVATEYSGIDLLRICRPRLPDHRRYLRAALAVHRTWARTPLERSEADSHSLTLANTDHGAGKHGGAIPFGCGGGTRARRRSASRNAKRNPNTDPPICLGLPVRKTGAKVLCAPELVALFLSHERLLLAVRRRSPGLVYNFSY